MHLHTKPGIFKFFVTFISSSAKFIKNKPRIKSPFFVLSPLFQTLVTAFNFSCEKRKRGTLAGPKLVKERGKTQWKTTVFWVPVFRKNPEIHETEVAKEGGSLSFYPSF